MARQLILILLATVFISVCAAAAPAAKKQTKLPHHNIDLAAVETGEFSDFSTNTLRPADSAVRVVGFNVKYGAHVDGIAEFIKSQLAQPGALVVCLSEADRNHTRSGDVNVALELAKRLKMNYAYGVEFVDFTDETPETQGTSGNAILTKLPISNTAVLRHTAAFDWSKPAMFSDKPRDGGRIALLADVEIAPGKSIRVVSAHLENRANAAGRAMQMDEIIAALKDVKIPAAIAGDLNEGAGTPMFERLKKAGYFNAFENDTTNTGGCQMQKDGPPLCLIKLDWILYRGLTLKSTGIGDILDTKGELISDHKPVSALFGY